MNQTVERVTNRIRQRSESSRLAYLERLKKMAGRARGTERMGCANVAHAFAALPGDDKLRVVNDHAPNIGIVTAYNDILSAHYEWTSGSKYSVIGAFYKDQGKLLGDWGYGNSSTDGGTWQMTKSN